MAKLENLLKLGDPDAVADAIQRGADIRYQRADGYTALIDAVHGRDIKRDPRLLKLLQVLIDNGVNLSGISNWSESGLRVLSRIGRFDAVRLLLSAGADESQLQWTPLMKAVAIGSIEEVKTELAQKSNLELTDFWERTAYLIALATGDISKTQLLLDSGADMHARGRCGAPPLFHTIRGHDPQMVQWLLQHGSDIHEKDDHGTTALIEAVEYNDIDSINLLLEAGADVLVDHHGTAAKRATSREICIRLVEAGADPADIDQRVMLGLPGETKEPLETISPEDYQRAKTRKFGQHNPQVMNEPFWTAMIRAGVGGYAARKRFETDNGFSEVPIWSAARFGQSLTILPDGRAVQIGGEHEDGYDPDFCIYNDVFVHHPDGTITIYGYPEEVFPPTDFHAATLVGNWIFIIGALGYHGKRQHEHTPVYRLDTSTFTIERLHPTGSSPGWIYTHRAELISDHFIRIWGGKIESGPERNDRFENKQSYQLDLQKMNWLS